jgi:glycolate oxidase iron-sulfur subunit
MSDHASPPSTQAAEQLLALADACVLCGLCLPHCPTYQLDRRESESPRGRVMLAQTLARTPLAIEESSVRALEHCLGCGRCEQVCPAKVKFGELMRSSRRLLPRRTSNPAIRALLWASRHPNAFAALLAGLRPLRGALPSAARRALAGSGRIAAARSDPRLPTEKVTANGEAARDASPPVPADILAPRRVGLLTGCVGRSLEARALSAAVRVLEACGHTVLVPTAQACCGALDQTAGRGQYTGALGERNRAVWSELRPDVLVSTASGCQAAFAAALATQAPVMDVASLLVKDARFMAIALRPIHRRVALHLPCTQRGLVGACDAIRLLLGRIPGLVWTELADTGCCGAGGAHVLQFPQRAQALRQPMVDAFVASGATTLVSANIGCRLHMAGADALATIDILHPLELLAEALP